MLFSGVDSSPLSSHGFLFVLLQQSDPDELGCPVFPHRNIATSVILAACHILERVLSSRHSFRRPCLCSGQCSQCRWVAHLNLMILREKWSVLLQVLMICDQGVRQLQPSFLEPWSRVVPTAQASARLILSSSAVNRADPDESHEASILLRRASR